MSVSDVYEHLNAFETTLSCSICQKMLKDPLFNIKCAHAMCRTCVDEQVDLICPVCKTPTHRKDFVVDKNLGEIVLDIKKLRSFLGEMNTNRSNIECKNSESFIENQKEIKSTFEDAIIQSKRKIQKSLSDSTPKILKKRNLTKDSLIISNSFADSIVKETPEQQSATPESRAKKSVIKRLSSNSASSPSKTKQSPSTLNKKNLKGETALQRAVIKGNKTKIEELLEIGAAVNTQDNNGWAPLHEACNRGFLDIAKLLLDHGALVDVPSAKDNITALHDALLNDQIEVAILLASRGADLEAKTTFGYSSLDLCKTEQIKKKLLDACSTFSEADTLLPDTLPNITTNKIVLLSSNLNEKQKQQLQKCAEMLQADIVDDFKPEVTHIVTSCDSTGNCIRTMKILLGILSGKWIMTFQWINICLEYKKKVDEETFEVQGTKNHPDSQSPKCGRQNHELEKPPLFDGLFFYLHGPFNKPTPSREDLCNLIHQGGGKVLSREPKPETVALQPYCKPFHVKEDINCFTHIILFQEMPPRDKHIKHSYICTSQVMWVIECISQFELLEPKQNTFPTK